MRKPNVFDVVINSKLESCEAQLVSFCEESTAVAPKKEMD